MALWHILVGRVAVPATLEEWSVWAAGIGPNGRHVGQTEVGPLLVSTVFLGLDHSFGGEHPSLFETMVFDHRAYSEAFTGVGGYQTRCETWGEAETMHANAVAWAGELVARSTLDLSKLLASDKPGGASDNSPPVSDKT